MLIALDKQTDPKQVIVDLADAIVALKAVRQLKGKVGVVGYRLGGSYAYHLATKDMVDCAVGYYGGQIADSLDEAKNLHCPLMLHFGEKDTHIALTAVEKIRVALQEKGN